MRSSQQCSETHYLSADWGPGDGHRKDMPWKHLLCGCSSLRGWAKRSLCYFPNKYSALFSVRLLHSKLLPCSPSQGALHLRHCSAARWLLYPSVTWWVTGVLGLVSFGILQITEQMPPSAHVCSTIRNNSQENPVSCALHIVVGTFTLSEAPTVTIPARDH